MSIAILRCQNTDHQKLTIDFYVNSVTRTLCIDLYMHVACSDCSFVRLNYNNIIVLYSQSVKEVIHCFLELSHLISIQVFDSRDDNNYYAYI